MIGFTAKITKGRFFAGIAILLIPFLIFTAVYISKAEKPKTTVFKAGTAEQRVNFLKQYGWDPDPTTEEVKDTVIPSVFDNVYEAYNSLQKAEGFDLSDYKGDKVKLYSIKINNYPKNSEFVYATLLVKDGIVIGGDIHSTELNGFMQGFTLD